jgi:dTMP kinase
MSRPSFLSLDGLDGCGKSTQCRLLADWLRGRGLEVVECADPGGTPLGESIRALLLDRHRHMEARTEALLFMASRAQLVDEIVRPALEAGRVVVSDRYLLSTVVYQGHAGGLRPEELWQFGRLATAGLEPELTLVLDLPVEKAWRRRTAPADRVESRDLAYHQRVREGFLAEARRQPDRIHIVNADQPVEAVHEQVCREVAGLL